MPLGIYISVPFCRSKCTFCNFASGVFSREKMSGYVDRLRQEIVQSRSVAASLGGEFQHTVDSIYVGGGTPTTLAPEQLGEIFNIIGGEFEVQANAEITVECAPGTLGREILDVLLKKRVNRVSLGTQSFVDEEIRSVGRLHTAEQTRTEIASLRENGISNISLDLIAGLPHQTRESWRYSLEQLVASGVPHASVYILEVDEDSRLGRELMAGGTRYHAHSVPDSDLTADLYEEAVQFLDRAGLKQYEISNFSRAGCESRHNLKYWTRQPYLGFGVDAHSMLFCEPSAETESVRFSNTDDLNEYLAGETFSFARTLTQARALEESMFLGLRLNRGVSLVENQERLAGFKTEIKELLDLGLLEEHNDSLRLTARGRLLSNEVFERFIAIESVAG
jgi:putative oxygen-independent coproporphyrinogen III oxidase